MCPSSCSRMYATFAKYIDAPARGGRRVAGVSGARGARARCPRARALRRRATGGARRGRAGRRLRRAAAPAARPRTDAHDEHVLDEDAVVLLLHVAVDLGAGQPPQDRDLRPHRLVDDDHEGGGDGEEDALLHAQEESGDEREDPEEAVLLLHVPQVQRVLPRHQRGHGRNHDGRQHKLGQVIEQWREEEEGEEHDDRGDQACGQSGGEPRRGARGGVSARASGGNVGGGRPRAARSRARAAGAVPRARTAQLRLGPRRVVHSRAREGAGHRVAAEERADEVGSACAGQARAEKAPGRGGAA